MKKHSIVKVLSGFLAVSMMFSGVVYAQSVDAAKETSDTVQTMAYDTTPPVIEDFEVLVNDKAFEEGMTLSDGDTLKVKANAYDQDSEIAQSEVTLYYGDDENSRPYAFTLELMKENNYYVGAITLDYAPTSSVLLDHLTFVDQNGNQSIKDIGYSFNTVSTGNIKLASLSQSFNQATVDIDSLEDIFEDVVVELNQPIASSYLDLEFVSEDGKYTISVSFVSENGNEGTENTKFVCGNSYSHTSPDYDCQVKYILDKVTFDASLGNYKITSDSIKYGDYSFYVNHKADVPSEGEDQEKPVIESVEIKSDGKDVNTNFIAPGSSLQIIVKATDNLELSSDAEVRFAPAADISYDYDDSNVSLEYDQDLGAFVGTYEISEDRYPCEWYIDAISVHDTSWNFAEDDLYSEGYPYYINVKNGDTFIDMVEDVSFYITVMGDDGSTSAENYTIENVSRRATFGDIKDQLSQYQSKIPGATQIGWTSSSEGSEMIDEDMPLINNYYLSLYPVFDKLVVPATLCFVNEDNKYEMYNKTFVLEKGTTYNEFLDILNSNKEYSEKITKDYTFKGWNWNYTLSDMDSAMEQSCYAQSLYSSFNGYLFMPVIDFTPDEYGVPISTYNRRPMDVIFVKEGTDKDGVEKYLNEVYSEPPKTLEGLRFSGFDFYFESVYQGSWIYKEPQFENCYVTYLLDKDFKTDTNFKSYDDIDYVYTQVAEKGETINTLDFNEFEGLTWLNGGFEDTLVVNDNYTFRGYYTSSTAERPQKPTDPTDPEEPGEPSEPTDPEEPENPSEPTDPEDPSTEEKDPVKLPQSDVDKVIEEIKNTQTGDTVEVSMKDATVVPVDILEEIKGKDVNVKLNMGGYSWTINGKDIKASDLKEINLEVKFDTNTIPSNTIKELAGDNPTKQISLTHNGDFGFKATLTLNAGAEYAGQYGNLYYYDSDGRMIFMNAGKIASDGSVSLEFSHASEYVLVMSDKVMGEVNSGESALPNTGNSTSVIPYALIAVLAVAALALLVVLRKKMDGIYQ